MISRFLSLLFFGLYLFAAPAGARTDPANLKPLMEAVSKASYTFDGNKNAENLAAFSAAINALIAAAEAAPAGPNTSPYLAHGLAERASISHENGDLDAAVADLETARRLLLPYRDAWPQQYIQASSYLGDIASRRAAFSDADAILKEAAAFLETRRGKDNGNAELDMPESNIHFAHSRVLLQLGRYEDAVKAQEASVDARERAVGPLRPETISARTHLATRYIRTGQLAEAEVMARTAAEQATAHIAKDDIRHVQAIEGLALVLGNVGKRAEAVEVARRALDIRVATTGANDYNFAHSSTTLGGLLADLGRYDEAVSILTNATKTLNSIGDRAAPADRLRTLTFLGPAQLGAGDAVAARASLEQAYVLWEKTKGAGTAETLLPALALARFDAGDATGAAEVVAAHLAAASNPRTPPLGKAQACAMAELLGTEGCGSGAGLALVRTIHEKVDASNDGELVQADRLSLEIAMRIAAKTGQVQLALDTTQLLTGSKVATATRLSAARVGLNDPRLAARLRELQDAESAYRRANSVYLLMLGNGGDSETARTVREAASRALADQRASLARDFPNWSAFDARRPVLASTLQASLAREDAALAIVPALASTFVMLATPDQIIVQSVLSTRAAFAKQADALRASIDAGAFDLATSHALYQSIFGSFSPATLKQVRNLRIVASGEAASIPFATLIEKPTARLSTQTPFLIRRFALSAGASLLRPANSEKRAFQTSPLLAIGAPKPFGETRIVSGKQPNVRQVFRESSIDTTSLAALPELTANEINAVAKRNADATLFTGADASEDMLQKLDLSRFRVLLFATHALVAGEMEGQAEPSLVLAKPATGSKNDGVLTASEISRLRLNADWAILSACNTAAGEGGATPAYSGLAQAFRYAGARTLMLSHWPVRDDAAAKLSERILLEAARGKSPAQALRVAMLKTMANESLEGAVDPRIWAPFVVFD
jgi:CHAT domain-containing protein